MTPKTKKLLTLGGILVVVFAVLPFLLNTMQGSISGGEALNISSIQNFDGGGSDLGTSARKFNLAFTNTLTLGMPAESVEPRFARARDACMNNAELKCVLIEASLNLDSGDNSWHRATLRLRLPHESVKVFENNLMSPLEGEKPGSVGVRDRATRADDLTHDVADTEARLQQLASYRLSLESLLSKPGAKIEDLLKIRKELADTQSQIEQMSAQKRNLSERIETELFIVNLQTAEGMGDNLSEIRKAWKKSGETFGSSAGAAIRFFFGLLPWLPVIFLAFYGLHLFLREPKKKDEA